MVWSDEEIDAFAALLLKEYHVENIDKNCEIRMGFLSDTNVK